jgi:tetratricopeptide (TPR) repeat protein
MSKNVGASPTADTDTEAAEAIRQHGRDLYNLGDYQGDVDQQNKALKLKPDYAPSYFSRGAAYAAMG